MEKSYELKYHKLEKEHWWFKSRRNIIIKLIQDKNPKILEVGCSSGALIKDLNNEGFKNVQGIDKSREAIKQCKKLNVQIMDGEKTKFKENSFDILIASDILEHIKNNNQALKEWNRILKENGKIILFVPALQFLWGKHDEINQHYKRYSKKELKELMKNSNFTIERVSYWNLISFMPKIIMKNKDQLNEINPAINNMLINLMKLENYLLTKINLPIGTSIFVIAKKIN